MQSDKHKPLLARLAAIGMALFFGCQQIDLQKAALPPASSSPDSLAPLDFKAQVAEHPSPVKLDGIHLGKSTVNDPELPKRLISLTECLALALEHGRTGMFFDGPGATQRTSVTGLTDGRNPSTATDSIRVFAYDPAIAATTIEEALSRFDVWGEASIFWNRIDQPNRFLSGLSAFDQVLNRNKVDDVDFSTGLYRRLPTGGFAGVRFRTEVDKNYLDGTGSTVVNPAYRPFLDFSFEQPLLQGAGVFINQVRDFHPGSIRHPFPDSGKPPGILLTRISHRQQQHEFERQVHELVYRVEEAYWQLYCAYWDFFSADNGMKQAHMAWQIAKARYDAGGVSVEDLALIEEQYQFFRQQRLQALGRGQPGRPGVLEAERRLRYVVGLPADDGTRLTPMDAPDFVSYDPDLEHCIVQAQFYRPELKQVEEEINAAYLNLAKGQDRLKPDLRFVGRYGINGMADDLGESINDLARTPHHEWEVGVRLQYPIGFRGGHAETTRARLQLAQRLYFLKDQREKLVFSLQRSHQELVQYQEQYKVRIRQREVAALQLKARFEKFKAGGDLKQPGSAIDLLLRAQRNWTDAMREEYQSLSNYRLAITDFERQKGTILRYANVTIADGPVPACVQPQASEYLRHRRKLLPRKLPYDSLAGAGVHVEVIDSFPLPRSQTTTAGKDAARTTIIESSRPQANPRPNTAPEPSPRASFGAVIAAPIQKVD